MGAVRVLRSGGRLVQALVVWVLALGGDPKDSQDERAQKAFLVGVSVGVLPAGIIWGALYWGLGEHVAALFPWAYTVISVLCLAVFARNRSFVFLRTAELSMILVTPALLLVALGGLIASSGVIVWSFLSPLGAAVFDRADRAWRWYAAFLVLLAVSIPIARVFGPDEAEMPYWAVLAFAALNIAAVSLVTFAVILAFARQRENARHRVESLLLDILPEEIAQRLQVEPQTIADHFEDASVLFADVVDFTPLSSRLDAREVVGLLDELFSSFDELADRYDVEKIKTIGDCYMVAAGVPRPRPDHAQALVRMAFDMHECAKACLADGGQNLWLRIGISSGPVVAGVIGRRRFLYDLWGDTVNMASRMESHGTPGAIQITRSTWELVRDDFVTEPLGFVDVKGKGEIETWRLVGPAPGLA
jgi:adenylate cyclase